MTRSWQPDDLALACSEGLSALACPDKAGPMQAYMKTEMPFYGVQAKPRRLLARQLARTFPPDDLAHYHEAVDLLWQLPHREEKYVAIAYARGHALRDDPANLELFATMIRQGAWWDLVDEIAIHLVGPLVARDPDALFEQLDAWIDDDDLWIRRSALIAQIGLDDHQRDRDRLYRYCLRRADEREFFIRKAIGWALREAAKDQPDSVRSFLAQHGHRLSGLSRREAEKHLR